VTGATSPTSATSVVFDASALLRAFVAKEPVAVGWLDRVASGEIVPAWPAHLYAEVAHTLLRLTRARQISPRRASESLGDALAMPARVRSLQRVLEEALSVGLERGLSVYDAAYVVLAEALDVPLVTADRRVASATEQAVLLPG